MEKRENFATRLGFILVSAGCAVGLGNVWKFPYICGQNGGAAFILIYLLCLILIGLPILLIEFSVGRSSRYSVAKAFETLEPENGRWHRFGWFGIIGNYLLMMFYTMVAGWMLNYAFKMASGKLSGVSKEDIGATFDNMLSSPKELIFFTIVAVVVSFGICALGLRNGVEKITKIMMLLLIITMIVLAVHSFTLPNVGEAVKFYFVPDFNKMIDAGIGNVVFAAMTHAFFTLSIGMGSMEIFGSYLTKDRSLTGEAINVMLLDTFVAITAGIIIIPACFAFGVTPNSGPSLLFITLPNVFNQMAGGKVWGTAFFVFMSFAALSTVIAVFENILSMTMEVFEINRKKAVPINAILIIILSMPCILGFNVWSKFEPLGAGTVVMDLEDFLVSYNILPLGGLLFVLFVTKKNGWGWDNFVEEVNQGKGIKLAKGLRWYVKYIVPVLIVVIYIKGYYDMFARYGKKVLAFWMVVAAAFLALIFSFTLSKKPKKQA